jgi:hypothetical protein
VCRSKHVEPSINGRIINSGTMLHLVGYFSWVCRPATCFVSLWPSSNLYSFIFNLLLLHKGKYKQKFIPTSKSSSPPPPLFLATLWGTPADFMSRYNCSLHFNVHGSVYRKTILIYIQQDAKLHSLFYLETALHVLGGTTTHHQERQQLYLQHLVLVTPLLLPVAIAVPSETCRAVSR